MVSFRHIHFQSAIVRPTERWAVWEGPGCRERGWVVAIRLLASAVPLSYRLHVPGKHPGEREGWEQGVEGSGGQ